MHLDHAVVLYRYLYMVTFQYKYQNKNKLLSTRRLTRRNEAQGAPRGMRRYHHPSRRPNSAPIKCSNHLDIFTTSKLDTVQDAHPQSAFHSWFNLLKALGRPDVPDSKNLFDLLFSEFCATDRSSRRTDFPRSTHLTGPANLFAFAG